MRRESLETVAQLEGQRYLDTVSLEQRRAGGQIYTPPYLADFVLTQARFVSPLRADHSTLLDPSCGAGVFLERAVAVIAEHVRETHGELTRSVARKALVAAVEANLFGVDVDETACVMTRNAVRRAIHEWTGSPLPASFFQSNVVHGDFLFSQEVTLLPPMAKDGFQFIVGNPPYVPTTRISAKYKERLRGSFESAAGRLDLYAMFMERALGLLARGGRLALLTPDKFLVSQSARDLRALLLHGNAIRTVARFRSHKVFADAATVPCVTVVERGGRPREVTVLSCADRPDASGQIAVLESREIQQRSLSSAPWHLHALDRHELARRLQGSHPTLAHLTIRVSAGPATGRDGVFVFPRGSQPGVEECLLRPVVRGRDLEPFRINDPGLEMLVPYVFDAAGNAALIDIKEFPGAFRYLRRHRAELEARHCVRVWRKLWYDLHDQISTDLAHQPKILVPDVANSNRFVVDSGHFLPLHSVYYLIPRHGVDASYLCAILNSRVAQFLVRLFSPVVKDGFNRYRQQFLANLPVPLVSTETAQEISTAARQGRLDEIDRWIARLFRLTTEEYETLSPLDDANGVGR
ncbi:MAG TPA: TaqI-like C-terminal specificity domain-containing protein [Polyangiaceae bacterium]|nr:TaqI-like C-terminal specificity domain-containing protein [Polyangiaceae bacterium]